MKIRRIILKNVRNFVDFDYTFEDGWTGKIPEALLLIGPNGSGKTTLLEVISGLWQILPAFLSTHYVRRVELPSSNLMLYGTLVAIEIVGLREKSLWLFSTHGGPGTLGDREFIEETSQAYRIGYHYPYDHNDDRMVRILGWVEPGLGFRDYYENASNSDVPEYFPKWVQEWNQVLTENLFGKRKDLPNVVYLESEMRHLLSIDEKLSVQPEPDEFRWLARYEPTTSRKGSLHNYLYNLKVVDETTFQQIVDETNEFLLGKSLNGFDRRTGDLMVKLENGHEHSINDLSSGEKQVLLMLATITRWLRPGGIVLIDEPDLHLHPTLTTAFVSHLRRMIKKKGGQLIIASHATELWQDFTESHRVELGRLGEMAA